MVFADEIDSNVNATGKKSHRTPVTGALSGLSSLVVNKLIGNGVKTGSI